MNLRTTTDPISGHEVTELETAPRVYEGDGENGIEIYFENETDRQTYLALGRGERIALLSNDAEDYVAEG
ncbi:MAG: hypothetical protein PVJ66_01330 [Gammaproteobacteria bacterium]|jgi:hypothetical protein